jgi:enolase
MTDMKVKVYLRRVLLSTGDFTYEAVINTPSGQLFESSPQGLTLGYNEASLLTKHKGQDVSFINESPLNFELDQRDFDNLISPRLISQITTALSLVFLKYRASVAGFVKSRLFSFISKEIGTASSISLPIFNILNGGKHAGNGLEFCEFMIIPKGSSARENIRIASEIYLDLRQIIETDLDAKHVLVGREGGFAPDISDIKMALDLIARAINLKNKGKCGIAIDVAANNFCEKKNSQAGALFEYTIAGKKYSPAELLAYYGDLLKVFPNIEYLEDPAHEDDTQTWIRLKSEYGKSIMIVGDDLTVTTIKYLKKNRECINACILKINQVGTFSDLVEAYFFCKTNGIKTIVSQRSGETDSDVISHIAIGLGSDYIKAGAPSRERIIKYNTMLRIEDQLHL